MKLKRLSKETIDRRRRQKYLRRTSSRGPKEKPFVRPTVSKVSPDEVKLVSGRMKNIADGKRLYWHIYYEGKRAGHVCIDYSEREGEIADASIDVQLNKQSRGRGIGTIAFRHASEMSGLPEVFASIRKSNVASRIAAERAGFVLLDNERGGELLMAWRRL